MKEDSCFPIADRETTSQSSGASDLYSNALGGQYKPDKARVFLNSDDIKVEVIFQIELNAEGDKKT